jgi:triosephosphate isomerase
VKKLIVGNWKMNQTLQQVEDFLGVVGHKLKEEAWIAPQALHVGLARSKAPTNIKIGAQNCSDQDHGAFTGENSPASLKEMGATFVLVGHSERRQLFQETNATCAAKTKRALGHGLVVIYCVGETLAEREANQTLNVVKQQLHDGLAGVGGWSAGQLVVAYEPVWAIGTGKVATPAQAQEVHAAIRAELKAMFAAEGEAVRLLYGGSVKPDNVHELMGQKDIDGALVGGASLKAADFIALCQAPA